MAGTGRGSFGLAAALWALVTLVALGCSDESGGAGGGTSSGTGGSGLVGGGGNGGGGGDGGSGAVGGGGGGATPTLILPKTGLDPSEVAILVNDQDPQSVEVAAYYQQARAIPADNVITLSFTPGANVLPEADFVSLKAQVDAAAGAAIQAFAITWTKPYRVDCMSVTAAFALGFDTQYCNPGGGCNPTASVDYFNSGSTAPFVDHGLRPAMSIVGSSTAEALALIDRGLAADGTFPTGDGYFVRTTDTARSVRWSSFVSTVDSWTQAGSLQLQYIDNSSGSGSNVIESTGDVLFYFTGLANVPSIETNTYLPGAVADHLTSYGGQVPDSGQMSIARWLEAGATASFGTVVEPCNYTQKFPDTSVMLPHYYRGETVLEAYWKSVSMPGEGLFAGEPLARPWGTQSVTFAAGALTIVTTALDPAKTYEVAAGDSEAGPWTVVLGDLTVPHHQLTTIVVEPIDQAVYLLREVGN